MIEEKRSITDEDLGYVNLCRKGDVDAFEALVRRHQKKMLNIAYRMLDSYEDACEVVQDAFVSAYRNINRFEGKSLFSTWLYAIVANFSRNRIKQIKSQGYHEQRSFDDPVLTDSGSLRIEPVSGEPSALEELEKRDIRKAVQDCINALDSEFKEVIVLRDVQGFSYDEIGDMLKIAAGTVKSRLFRARDSVKNCLKNVMGEL